MVEKFMCQVEIRRVTGSSFQDVYDELSVEEPLEMRLAYTENGNSFTKNISVTMRTPGNDGELACGFLFTEGIIRGKDELELTPYMLQGDNVAYVFMKHDATPLLQKTERNFYTTSSCGVCGKASIDAIKTVSVFKQTADHSRISASIFYLLQDALREQQQVFQRTGGLHAAAIFSHEGRLLMLREDVGRHNAVDKIIGAALLNADLPLDKVILLLSGRASFELLQKAAMAGIKIVAAVGAPSTLAVQLAKESGITLLGFLREGRFNIYSRPERILYGS